MQGGLHSSIFMNCSEEIVLSILVISHNQENCISRCINSILRQSISCKFEIIISDDYSTDKTWHIIQEYVCRYPGKVFGYQINSSDVNPVNRSERCGYNKANAYSYARGKYFVNIDADDFLLGDDIYQLQVDTLDKHPECSLCMQNVAYYQEGDPLVFDKLYFKEDKFKNGQILTPREFIINNYFIVNPAFMMRRLDLPNPAEILGKHFDDTMITYYHLQFGKIIYVNRAQYAYVISKNSINSSLTGPDREVTMFALVPYHILFIPKFAGLFLRGGLKIIKKMMKMTINSSHIKEDTKKWLIQFPGFCFQLFSKNKLNIIERLRIKSIWRLVLFIEKSRIHCNVFYRLLFILLVDYKTLNKNFNFSAK